MPHHEPEKYLYDMLSSCEFLLEFTSNKAVGDYYTNDRAFGRKIAEILPILTPNSERQACE